MSSVSPPLTPVEPRPDPVDVGGVDAVPSAPMLCANGAAAADNPALCIRGPLALPGIDQIPLDQVKVTNKEMQKMFVIADGVPEHALDVGGFACESYITMPPNCFDSNDRTGKTRLLDGTVQSRTGSAPFTELVDLNMTPMDIADPSQDIVNNSWLEQTMRSMGTVKIANYSLAGAHALAHIGDGNLPYLIIHSAGNGSYNLPWFRDEFTLSERDMIRGTIAADKLIFIAGWDRDASGNYIRDDHSNNCQGIDSGCLWVQFAFPDGGAGTSFSAPLFASALASVLAVFPDTSHQDLAKFGKSCAKKTGEGIEALLAQSGGLGVADFTCMGDVVSALTDLPTGSTANVVIGRRLSLPTVYYASYETVLAGVPENGGSISTVANGEEGAAITGAYSNGAVFASLAAGPRDDFFGYTRGHEGVLELRGSAGHRNLFLTFSEQYSVGGDAIRSARGSSVALLAQERFVLTEHTTLTASAGMHRFLGGSADFSAGSVDLNTDGWDRHLSLSSTTAIDTGKTVGLGAVMRTPDGRPEEFAVGANFNWRF